MCVCVYVCACVCVHACVWVCEWISSYVSPCPTIQSPNVLYFNNVISKFLVNKLKASAFIYICREMFELNHCPLSPLHHPTYRGYVSDMMTEMLFMELQTMYCTRLLESGFIHNTKTRVHIHTPPSRECTTSLIRSGTAKSDLHVIIMTS